MENTGQKEKDSTPHSGSHSDCIHQRQIKCQNLLLGFEEEEQEAATVEWKSQEVGKFSWERRG